jgi:ribosomal protein S18 acetylase RimI-like enzyme
LKSRGAVAIRNAALSDAGPLAALMGELGYRTTAAQMRARLRRILADSRYKTLVAELSGKLCGMVGTIFHPSYEHDDLSGRIIVLVVSAKTRQHGIGRELVAAAEKQFAKNGIRRVAVNTRLTRKEAHQFYQALGYQRNGFRFVKQLG